MTFGMFEWRFRVLHFFYAFYPFLFHHPSVHSLTCRFILLNHLFYRSAVIRNLADLITYRRKYASHTELYVQLMMIWAECCVTYCELVISAKMEQLIEQSSGSINPLSMSIRFDVFMNACDDICEKRITAKCAIQYIDGQLSLNELLQFIFQVYLHFIVWLLYFLL